MFDIAIHYYDKIAFLLQSFIFLLHKMDLPHPPGGNIPVDPGPPGLPPPPVGGGLPGPVDGELLFLPDPEAGVLNHGIGGPVPPVVGQPLADMNNQAVGNQNKNRPMLKVRRLTFFK